MDAWQKLDSQLATIDAIGRIAAQFGCRTARFPLIEEYTLGDGFRLHDAAIWCCDGPNLVADLTPFMRPDQGHRSSPWLRVALRLHTLDSARDRYRVWAASEWERLHAGPVTSWLDEHGQAHEMVRPVNPYAEPAKADA